MEQPDLAALPRYLSDEIAAWELLERLRWPEGTVVCPHCGVADAAHYFITSRSGYQHTRIGTVTYRRLWRCRACRKQFSVLVGTIFESSKIAVSKWLLAMWLFNAGSNSVSALELQRHLGIAYQSAWSMAHRLREATTRRPLATLVSGTTRESASHDTADHRPGEYVRDGTSTNLAASFFARFDQSLTSTHHNVSRKHFACGHTPSSGKFDEFVASALAVNPTGLSGKHRHKLGSEPREAREPVRRRLVRPG